MAIGKFEGFHLPELILSLFALLAIFWLVDPRKLFEIIAGANPWFFLLALCAYFSTVLLMTYRIRLILGKLHEKIGWKNSYMANAGGLLASDFTPARTGYFITPFLLSKNFGVPLEKGMVTIVSPQIAEFFLKALGAAGAIFVIASAVPQLSQNSIFMWLGVGMMLTFSSAMYLALFTPRFLELAQNFSFLPFAREGIGFITSLQAHREKVKALFPQIFLISAITFLCKGTEWFLFAQAIGLKFAVDTPAIVIFMVLQPLITVFQFVPFPTVAGLGISEGSAVASMSLLGVSPELAVAHVLLVRGGTMLVNSLGVFQLVPFVLQKKKKA